MQCPCHSGKEYSACCGPYHEGQSSGCCGPYHKGQSPPTPLQLMRSRYSAYALGKVDYIIATTHSLNPDRAQSGKKWRESIQAFCNSTDFTGLEILEEGDSTVTFRAILGEKGSYVEKSEFGQEGGKWRYKKALSLS